MLRFGPHAGDPVKDRADAIIHSSQARYLEALEAPRPALLKEMEELAAREGRPISDLEVATFLRVVCQSRRPRRVVEVGTNIGYGAIVLAQACGPEAVVETVELDPGLVKVSNAFVAFIPARIASRT